MKSILEEFAYGNINPNDGTITRGSHYDKTMKALVENENRLLEELDGELAEIFKRYSDLQLGSTQIANVDKFIYGYRLGVLMTMEVFCVRDNAIFGRDDDK